MRTIPKGFRRGWAASSTLHYFSSCRCKVCMLAYTTSSSHNESGAVLTKLASERPHASYEFQDPSNTNFIWQACVKWWARARLNCMLCKIRCGIYEYASNNTKVRRTKLLPNKNTLTRTLHSNPDLSFYSRLDSLIFRLGPSRISFAIKHSSAFNKFSSKNNLHKWRWQFQLDAERLKSCNQAQSKQTSLKHIFVCQPGQLHYFKDGTLLLFLEAYYEDFPNSQMTQPLFGIT